MENEKNTSTGQEQKTQETSVDKLLTMLDETKKDAVAEFISKVGKESQVFKVTGALTKKIQASGITFTGVLMIKLVGTLILL